MVPVTINCLDVNYIFRAGEADLNKTHCEKLLFVPQGMNSFSGGVVGWYLNFKLWMEEELLALN